jgi:hypothetical protein
LLEASATTNEDQVNSFSYAMKLFFSWLLLTLLGVVSALSSSGSRLLVVLEDTSEKEKYSQFWGDLEGKETHISPCEGLRTAIASSKLSAILRQLSGMKNLLCMGSTLNWSWRPERKVYFTLTDTPMHSNWYGDANI